MRRGLAILLAATIGIWGCASGSSDEKRAFLEAGRKVKLAQPPPTNAELRRDLGLFLESDLFLTFDKAKAREAKQSSTVKIVFGAGVGTILVGATAGSLNGGAEAAVIGAGAAAIVGSAIAYFGPVKKLHECQEFLAFKGAQLKQWEARYVGDSSQPVSPSVWRDYVNFMSEIQLHENCLVVR